MNESFGLNSCPLQDENRRLNHFVADLTLPNFALKDVLGKKW